MEEKQKNRGNMLRISVIAALVVLAGAGAACTRGSVQNGEQEQESKVTVQETGIPETEAPEEDGNRIIRDYLEMTTEEFTDKYAGEALYEEHIIRDDMPSLYEEGTAQYTSALPGTVLRFYEGYEGEILEGITVGMDKEKVKAIYGEPDFINQTENLMIYDFEDYYASFYGKDTIFVISLRRPVSWKDLDKDIMVQLAEDIAGTKQDSEKYLYAQEEAAVFADKTGLLDYTRSYPMRNGFAYDYMIGSSLTGFNYEPWIRIYQDFAGTIPDESAGLPIFEGTVSWSEENEYTIDYPYEEYQGGIVLVAEKFIYIQEQEYFTEQEKIAERMETEGVTSPDGTRRAVVYDDYLYETNRIIVQDLTGEIQNQIIPVGEWMGNLQWLDDHTLAGTLMIDGEERQYTVD